VPFSVPGSGELQIASLLASKTVSIPSGEYELTFLHGLDSQGAMWADFEFVGVSSQAKPRILKHDRELNPPVGLLMSAEPA
jgi:hypothetical protein